MCVRLIKIRSKKHDKTTLERDEISNYFKNNNNKKKKLSEKSAVTIVTMLPIDKTKITSFDWLTWQPLINKSCLMFS